MFHKSLSGNGSIKGKKFEIYDKYLNKKIAITVEKEIEFIYFTLYTVSQSEIGIDLTEQGITIAFGMPFSKEMNIKGTLSIG